MRLVLPRLRHHVSVLNDAFFAVDGNRFDSTNLNSPSYDFSPSSYNFLPLPKINFRHDFVLWLTFKTVTSRDLARLLLFCMFSEILPALWCWGRGGGMTARKRERSANPVWRRKRSLLRCQYSKLIIFPSSFFSKTLVCLFTKTTKSLWQHLRFPFCARALRSACFTQGPRRAFLCAGGHVWEASWWTDRGQR